MQQRNDRSGPRHGAIVQAVPLSGVAERDLMMLELNCELQKHLPARWFPGLPVVLGDALKLQELAGESRYLTRGPVDAVVSVWNC